MLERVHPVLVRPQVSANIGAAVRAAKAMGLGPVMLVAPHAPIDESARSLAAGSVRELGRVKSFETLADAVAGAVRVYGLSARKREHRTAPIWLEDAARDAVVASKKGRVLFLFGTERSGLENEELDYAQRFVRIPTSSKFRSINLAQSVMLTAYELLKASGTAEMEEYDYEPATMEDVGRTVAALGEALDKRDFFIPKKRPLALRRIHDLLGRSNPTANEIALLRGMIRSLDEDRP